MAQEVRLQIIEDLIKKGKDLLEKPYTSPARKLWEDDVVRFLEDIYDDRLVEIFNESFTFNRIVEHGEEQEHYEEGIQNALDFLVGLKLKQPPEKPLNSLGRVLELEKKYNRNEHNKPRQYGATTNNYYIDNLGALHNGKGDIVQNITVGDIISKISGEIEKLQDSQEKKSVLQSLKNISTNPTFASISGTFIGAFLNSMVNPTRAS